MTGACVAAVQGQTSTDACLPLQGKVAMVTGALGGMGTAVCESLLRDGAIIIATDIRSPDPANADRAQTHFLQCDTGSESEVQAVFKAVAERFGRLDFIVHCAALPQGGVIWKLPVDEWDRIIRTNLRSGFLLAHFGIPLMRASGDGGRFVMIGSTSGSVGRMGQCAYAASKGGLNALTKTIAREGAAFGILANIIEPGVIRTPMSGLMPDAVREQALASTLLARMGEPEDIASMVTFLCGPGGRHITGQIIRVDGGEQL
jgi:3-oxoacyl-[acyl-carrier protein] reductase